MDLRSGLALPSRGAGSFESMSEPAAQSPPEGSMQVVAGSWPHPRLRGLICERLDGPPEGASLHLALLSAGDDNVDKSRKW